MRTMQLRLAKHREPPSAAKTKPPKTCILASLVLRRSRTREDKYEPKKKQSEKPNPEKPTRKRRGKKGDQKKAARKASESLKDNFNSNKIGQERLTIGALYYWTRNFQEWKSFIANEAEGIAT
ncbi:hypothetical protein CJF30_00002181 [Rutstroemia sp. NJR-2017a BBW]|nr:hypothetical protein CJF30_00002181 [Rutstroemia sp. NJR-2017a BBW]